MTSLSKIKKYVSGLIFDLPIVMIIVLKMLVRHDYKNSMSIGNTGHALCVAL